MNFLTVFERRIASVFGEGRNSMRAPLSFKKLAKKAAREMENETFVINGQDTAPALYTILISSSDDDLMRPFYPELIEEISRFISAQAKSRDYVFVADPLVRFMVDPSLKSGRFAVFAENVDARTLMHLAEEERLFATGGSGGLGGAVVEVERKAAVPKRGNSISLGALHKRRARARAEELPAEDGFDQAESYDNELEAGYAGGFAAGSVPAAGAIAGGLGGAAVAGAAAGAAASYAASSYPAASPAPATQRRHVPLANNRRPQVAGPRCILRNAQTGQDLVINAPGGGIGRDRAGLIVLRDPNVSRHHAEIYFDNSYGEWHIRDLNSTNGTMVNNLDIDDCILQSGDLITIGLINLEFRES